MFFFPFEVHETRVSTPRLLLPELLPCVKKTLWIDADAIVVAPLAPLFAIQPSAPCGIAARESVVHWYLAGGYHGPDRDIMVNKLSAMVSFNAGVVLMDLDILRASNGYSDLVKKVGFKYGNDDQVTLNLWCGGKYTKLDKKWNVFNNMRANSNRPDSGDPELERNAHEWGVVHFAGACKPWSAKSCFANAKTRRVWEKFGEDYWGQKFTSQDA